MISGFFEWLSQPSPSWLSLLVILFVVISSSIMWTAGKVVEKEAIRVRKEKEGLR